MLTAGQLLSEPHHRGTRKGTERCWIQAEALLPAAEVENPGCTVQLSSRHAAVLPTPRASFRDTRGGLQRERVVTGPHAITLGTSGRGRQAAQRWEQVHETRMALNLTEISVITRQLEQWRESQDQGCGNNLSGLLPSAFLKGKRNAVKTNCVSWR